MAPACYRTACVIVSLAQLVVADDIQVVRNQLLQLVCLPTEDSMNYTIRNAIAFTDSLLPNATWADVNYDDPEDLTIWQTFVHMARVNTMVQASTWPGATTYNNASMLTAARAALDAWLTRDFINDNWWWNDIETPQAASCIYLMLGMLANETAPAPLSGFPSALESDVGNRIMYRASWWNASMGYEVTGANLAWMLQVQLTRGVLPFAVNASAVSQGFTRLWQEIKIVDDISSGDGQGIQVDRSFHMHSQQLQQGSYGQDYTNEMVQFIAVAANTSFLPSQDALNTLCSYWADGSAWMSVGNAFDWTAIGRQVDRNVLIAEFQIYTNVTQLREVAMLCNRTADVLAWADRIVNDTTVAPLVGARHFYNSDFFVHRRPGWVSTVHMHSVRTHVPECLNGENLLGEHMGNGVNTLYSTDCSSRGGSDCGDAYALIFPLFDWHLLPGVMAEFSTPIPDCSGQCCWLSQIINTEYVGGVEDGMYGFASGLLATHGLTSFRSWFHFDDLVAAVYSNVTDSTDAVVRVTLASRYIAGVLTLGFANGSSSLACYGVYNFTPADSVTWVHADGFAYIAPSTYEVFVVEYGPRCGDWSSIGVYTGTQCGTMLTVSAQLGAHLTALADAYYILPNVTVDDVPSRLPSSDVLPVAADAVHAYGVLTGGSYVVQASFAPGAFPGSPQAMWSAAGWNVTLSASAPALVQYREDATTGAATIAVSCPLVGQTSVAVGMNRAFQATPSCPVTAVSGGVLLSASLPSGNNSIGASVVYTCVV